MSIEMDDIGDYKRISGMAWIGFFLSVIGLVGTIEERLIIVPVIAIITGTIPLLFAKRWNLGPVSVAAAFLAVVLGVFSASFGATRVFSFSNRLYSAASQNAKTFIKLVQEDNLEAAYRLHTSQIKALGDKTDAPSMYNTVQAQESEKEAFLNGQLITELKKNGKDAKWVYVGPKEIMKSQTGIRVDVIFKDISRPNPRNYVIFLARENPRPSKPKDFLWFVVGGDFETKK